MDIPRADVREGAATGRDKSHAEGVFDWTRERPVRGLGDTQQAHRNSQKDIPMPCLPTLPAAQAPVLYSKPWSRYNMGDTFQTGGFTYEGKTNHSRTDCSLF